VTYSFRTLKFQLFLLYFKCYTYSVSNVMAIACSEECGCTFWRDPNLSNEMKLEAGHKPCHLPCGGGLVSPMGDIATDRFASRTYGARPKWRECAENHAVFQCCQESVPASPVQASAERMAWIFRSVISKGIDWRRKILARALFSGVRARKQVCGLLLEALKVPQHDCIIPNGASASASGARCS